MKALILIESAYQLANFIKFKQHMGISDFTLFIRDNANPHQLEQCIKILHHNRITNFNIFKLPSEGWSKFFLIPFVLLRLLFHFFQKKVVVLGDLRSSVSFFILKFSSVFYKEIIVVDDGLYILNYLKKIQHRKYTIHSNLPLTKYLSTKESKLTLYQYTDSTFALNKEVALHFVGQKLSEIGLIDEKTYLNYLDDIKVKFKYEKNIYFAHRDEELGKLQKIKTLGYDVIKPSVPLEDYMLDVGAMGGTYVTFYSTAVYNLKQRIPHALFFAIQPNRKFWKKDDISSIKACYDLFKCVGIEVLKDD
jgi:hypothetical protein